MVAFSDLSPTAPSSNPYLSTLTGPYGFRTGYVVTYVLQGSAGDTAANGGTLWAQANAAQAFQLAAQTWAAVANITIKAVTTGYDGSGTTTATWIEKLEKLDDNVLGEHFLPGTNQLGGSFNNTASLFTAANNAVGGRSFVTFIHEIGHGLGLLHPHESGKAFPGVTGEWSMGDNDLNQQLYTVMSYNDGKARSMTSSDAFGWALGPMAFDIAAIQQIYGANLSTAAGDDMYQLPAVNAASTGWICIWDAGGIDTIRAADMTIGATIDLRSATLRNEPGGGGYLSRASGIAGGFTIANGVIIENATGSTGNDVINGNDVGNRLIGNGGYDTIEGFAGDDWIEGSGNLSGGDGNDRLIASGTGNDLNGGTGNDTLEGSGYLSGGDGDDRLVAASGSNNNLTGGAGNDYLEGSGFLDGGEGNDRLIQTGIINGLGSLTGGAGDDTLQGGTGNDLLDGGTGRDLMAGGFGNDIYTLDDAGDQIVELDGQGNDTVNAYLSYVLGSAIEHANLIGASALTLTGNDLANSLTGNEYANVIIGGAGADTMAGGGGNDIYYVDSADDVVWEFKGGGSDTVYASVSYVLPEIAIDPDPYAGPSVLPGSGQSQIEKLILTGSADLNGTGSEYGNEIVGNDGNNFLSGKGGNDVLAGGAGRNVIDGGAGTDTLVLAGTRASYTMMQAGDAAVFVSAAGSALALSVEKVRFAGRSTTFSLTDAMAGAKTFDAMSYIASYADLRAAFGTDDTAGMAHFQNAGFVEGRSVSFDGWGYLASYNDLRTAFGADITAAARHYISSGIAEGRSISFDALGYVASYSDLRKAFGTNAQAAEQHYVQFGATEGRGITFDALAYIASYADLRSAYGTNSAAATQHFIQYGAGEGRKMSFDAWNYLASYTDLRAAFGTDVNAATRHFIQYGAAEGRSLGFDASRYLASYTDLLTAFGTDKVAAARHYVTAGAVEGRQITFDALQYGAVNADLARAFGDNQTALVQHYVSAGFGERRPTIGFDKVGYLLTYSDLSAAKLGADGALHHWLRAGVKEGRIGDTAFGRDQTDHALNDRITGQFDWGQDKDWFNVSAKAGQRVTLDYTGTLDAVLELHRSDGSLVARGHAASGTHGQSLTFTADMTDIYYLVVAGSGSGTAGGSYGMDLYFM